MPLMPNASIVSICIGKVQESFVGDISLIFVPPWYQSFNQWWIPELFWEKEVKTYTEDSICLKQQGVAKTLS